MSGELADGASLNWCTPEQIAWSREHIAKGAAKAGRDPSEINVAEYIQDLRRRRRGRSQNRSRQGYHGLRARGIRTDRT